MHDFKYRNNRLFCEKVDLAKVVKTVNTPVFVYSQKTLIDHFLKIKKAFSRIDPLICYSMKANSNLALCRLLVKAGAGIDIVSGGELYRAKKIKTPGKKIVYASVGKTKAEIEQAIKAGILFFNVESVPELILINKIAKRLHKKQCIAIRINPDIAANTHQYITTAKKQNKFGLDIKTTKKIFSKMRQKLENVNICAIHVHIGSQIEQVKPFIQALKKTIDLIDELNHKETLITHLNIGGGLGIVYKNEKPQTASQYAQAILPIIGKRKLKLILEPGRFIAGNAGIILTKIIYVKDTPVKRFFIVDAAMNDLLRPAFYDAHHEIIPLNKSRNKKTKKADIVGPICESGDFLAKHRYLPSDLKSGDAIAIMSTGAYGFSMSSNYNSRRKAAEVMVSGKNFRVIRKRDSYEDLIRNEIIN
ncbi:MAG: diaminopimelate decarboxylase [Candidatus Omnitrophota bacterium]